MAHFFIKQKDGTYKDVIYMYMLPTYYIIPPELLKKVPKQLNEVNRNPYELFGDRKSLDIIGSDIFAELVIDGMAYMVWPYIAEEFKLHPNMEVYSGYHPAWILAHSAPLWQEGLIKAGLILDTQTLFTARPDISFPCLPYSLVSQMIASVFPSVLESSGYRETIHTFIDIPCPEDFSEFQSNPKRDFYKKWYHSRAKMKTCSLEEEKEKYSLEHDGEELDFPDESYVLDKDAVGSVHSELFINSLSEMDQEIMKLRLREWTTQEIADTLGYKTHSAILKRLKKIGESYIEYAGNTLGLEP